MGLNYTPLALVANDAMFDELGEALDIYEPKTFRYIGRRVRKIHNFINASVTGSFGPSWRPAVRLHGRGYGVRSMVGIKQALTTE